jgi:hypothetical protein
VAVAFARTSAHALFLVSHRSQQAGQFRIINHFTGLQVSSFTIAFDLYGDISNVGYREHIGVRPPCKSGEKERFLIVLTST